MLKYGGPVLVSWLTKLFQAIWNGDPVPVDWKRGIILPVFKGKGSCQDCRNYRGISLLFCPGKVFAHISLSQVKDTLLAACRMEQSGFTLARSTIDRIATLNLIVQGRRESQQPLWVACVDLKAAFNGSTQWITQPYGYFFVVWVCLPRLWIWWRSYILTQSAVTVSWSAGSWWRRHGDIHHMNSVFPAFSCRRFERIIHYATSSTQVAT